MAWKPWHPYAVFLAGSGNNSRGAGILRAKGENFYLGLQLLFSQAGGRNESPPHSTSQPPHTAERPSCREKVDGAEGMFPNVLGSGLGGKGIQLIAALHDSGPGSLSF